MQEVALKNQKRPRLRRNEPSAIEEVFRLYDRAMAATSTGIAIADATQPTLPIIYCNPAFEKITGYSRDEVIGRNCRFLQGSDTDQAAIREIRRALKEERECKVILKNYRKDGTPFWNELTISPVRDYRGRLTHFIGVQTDITERKEAEEALQQAEAKYRSIFENATEGIYQTTSDGRYLSANPALARIYGYDSPEELMQRCSAQKLYVTRDRHAELTRQIRKKGAISDFESAVYRKDGSIIWIKENVREIRNQSGALLYYQGTVTDVTERKLSEAALRNQEYWLQTSLDAVPDAIILKDGRGRWVVANQTALKLFGLEGVDYRGLTAAELSQYAAPGYGDLLQAERETDESTWGAGTITYSTQILPLPVGGNVILDVRKVPLFVSDSMEDSPRVSPTALDNVPHALENGYRSISNRDLETPGTYTQAQGGIRKGLVVVGRDITDRVRAEAALLDSEKRFRTIFEGAAIGMALVSWDGQKLKATNPTLQAMLGYVEEELRGMSLEELTLPEDVALDEALLGELMAGLREAYKCEKRYLRKDGSAVWGCLSVSSIRSERGQPQFILATIEDISDRKQAEYRLSQINKCFLEFGTDAIGNIQRLVALAGEILAGDCAFYDRLVNDNLHAIAHWGEPSDYRAGQEARRHGGAEAIRQAAAGAVVVCNVQNAIYAQTDSCLVPYQLHTYLGQAVRLRETYVGALSVVYTKSYVPTPSDLKLLGIIAGAIGVEEERAAAAASEREKSRELEIALQELKQTQLQLIQTEKMSSLGQLVAGVAHEINNPLSFVTGNLSHANDYILDVLDLVQLYQQQYPAPTPEIKQKAEAIDLEFIKQDLPNLLESMKMGAQRICQIVATLRNFSRIDKGEIKAVDIHEGIEDTLVILHNRLKSKPDRPEIQVIREYGNLPPVQCYAGQLNQVFMNILANAIDALEEWYGAEGTAQSSATIARRPTIRISTQALDADWVTVRIADNGPGMSEEVRRKLFDPFFTTKPVGKGTGLGLSISFQIVVEKHGGFLRCVSEPGSFTEFIIELPIRPRHRA